MPEVFREGPYRVYFFSKEGHEPPHVHVEHDDRLCKFWLEPVALAGNAGFAPHELFRIARLIDQRKEQCLERWHRHFGPQGR